MPNSKDMHQQQAQENPEPQLGSWVAGLRTRLTQCRSEKELIAFSYALRQELNVELETLKPLPDSIGDVGEAVQFCQRQFDRWISTTIPGDHITQLGLSEAAARELRTHFKVRSSEEIGAWLHRHHGAFQSDRQGARRFLAVKMVNLILAPREGHRNGDGIQKALEVLEHRPAQAQYIPSQSPHYDFVEGVVALLEREFLQPPTNHTTTNVQHLQRIS